MGSNLSAWPALYPAYRRAVAVSLVLCGLGLSQSCTLMHSAQQQSIEITSPIITSANDQRQYRRIKLPNNLDVLLISDPTADKAAASLDIYMGSYQNPRERQGLAHFLEHMLFLGTEQYPEADEYQTFISEHGGAHNAYTSFENTNYFFDIDAEHLQSALDRFAPFFTYPTFDADYVDRERNAVESEYRLKLKDHARRQWDVLRELIHPQHPLSKFTVGNLQTLADREDSSIRDELIAMYRQYYAAELMKLVVLGKQSVDELQTMVSARFSSIDNKNTSIDNYGAPYLEPSKLPLQVHIRPLKESRELSLLFELPNLSAYWQTKPAQYLAALIGYEGQGSLLQALKDKGWAESLSAGIVLEDREGSLFAIDIGLTPKGFESRDKILVELFAWIKLIKNSGIQSWRQDELATLGDIEFRFAEKQNPTGYVADLADRMHRYAGAELLRGPYVATNFDRAAIDAVAAKLSPKNMLVMITAPNISVETNSKYYQTPYSVSPVDPQLLQPLSSAQSRLPLRLAEKNPFMPTDLSLIEAGLTERPTLIKDVAGLRVWHLENIQFGVPKAHIIISLGSEKTATLEGSSAAQLYVAYIQDQLNSNLYPALMAGLTYSIQASEQGISILLGGYSEKQKLLLEAILATFAEPTWDLERFESVKQQLIRENNNSRRDYPFRQIMAALYSSVEGRWTQLEQVPAIEAIDMPALQAFAKQLLEGFDIKVLISGNHDQQTAFDMVEQLNLQNKAIDKPLEIAKLSEADLSQYFDIDHKDSVVAQYIQGDSASLTERATVSLLTQIISAPFFNQLRTEKQLGYVVAAFPMHANRVPGLCMLVQSPVASEAQLRSAFQDFVVGFASQIKALTAEDLLRHQSSLLVNLQEEPKNLMELNARFGESLRLGYKDFLFRDQLADAIRTVTIAEINAAYDRLLLNNPRRLWVQTSNGDKSIQSNENSGVINQRYEFLY